MAPVYQVHVDPLCELCTGTYLPGGSRAAPVYQVHVDPLCELCTGTYLPGGSRAAPVCQVRVDPPCELCTDTAETPFLAVCTLYSEGYIKDSLVLISPCRSCFRICVPGELVMLKQSMTQFPTKVKIMSYTGQG